MRTLNFYSVDLDNSPLNGLWIDFAITVLIYFYLNSFNFWLVSNPHKIIKSDRTRELVKIYLQGQSDTNEKKDWKEIHAELKGETFFNKALI